MFVHVEELVSLMKLDHWKVSLFFPLKEITKRTPGRPNQADGRTLIAITIRTPGRAPVLVGTNRARPPGGSGSPVIKHC